MYVSTYKPYEYLCAIQHTICTYIHTCICAYLFWSRKFSDALKETSFELVFRTQLLSHVSRSIHSKTLTDQPPNPTSRQVRQLVSLPPFRLSVAQTKICLHALYKYRSSSSRRHPPPPPQWLNAPVSKEHNRCRYTVSHTSKTLVKHRRRRAAHKNSHSSGGQSAHLVSLSDLNLYGRSQINIYSTFARVHSLEYLLSVGQGALIGWATTARRQQPSWFPPLGTASLPT